MRLYIFLVSLFLSISNTAAEARRNTLESSEDLLLMDSSFGAKSRLGDRGLFLLPSSFDFYNQQCQENCQLQQKNELLPFLNPCSKCGDDYSKEHCNHCCHGGASSLRLRWHGCPGTITIAPSTQLDEDCGITVNTTEEHEWSAQFVDCDCYASLQNPSVFESRRCALFDSVTVLNHENNDEPTDICIVATTGGESGNLINLRNALPSHLGLSMKTDDGVRLITWFDTTCKISPSSTSALPLFPGYGKFPNTCTSTGFVDLPGGPEIDAHIDAFHGLPPQESMWYEFIDGTSVSFWPSAPQLDDVIYNFDPSFARCTCTNGCSSDPPDQVDINSTLFPTTPRSPGVPRSPPQSERPSSQSQGTLPSLDIVTRAPVKTPSPSLYQTLDGSHPPTNSLQADTSVPTTSRLPGLERPIRALTTSPTREYPVVLSQTPTQAKSQVPSISIDPTHNPTLELHRETPTSVETPISPAQQPPSVAATLPSNNSTNKPSLKPSLTLPQVPCITVNSENYSCGSPITITFNFADPLPDDWIGIYPCNLDIFHHAQVWKWSCGASDCLTSNGTGAVVFDRLPPSNAYGPHRWPLTPYLLPNGTISRCFQAHLLRNDGPSVPPYEEVCGSSSFEVFENSDEGCGIQVEAPEYPPTTNQPSGHPYSSTSFPIDVPFPDSTPPTLRPTDPTATLLVPTTTSPIETPIQSIRPSLTPAEPPKENPTVSPTLTSYPTNVPTSSLTVFSTLPTPENDSPRPTTTSTGLLTANPTPPLTHSWSPTKNSLESSTPPRTDTQTQPPQSERPTLAPRGPASQECTPADYAECNAFAITNCRANGNGDQITGSVCLYLGPFSRRLKERRIEWIKAQIEYHREQLTLLTLVESIEPSDSKP